MYPVPSILDSVSVMWQLGLRGVRWGKQRLLACHSTRRATVSAGTVHARCCGGAQAAHLTNLDMQLILELQPNQLLMMSRLDTNLTLKNKPFTSLAYFIILNLK